MKSLAFKLWSGLKATSGYPTDGPFRVLRMNTKGNGTTTLFAALETATGLVKAGHYKRRRRREFLDFMNGVIDSYGNEKEIHVILDNLNTHRPKNDRWLKSHPNVHFTF